MENMALEYIFKWLKEKQPLLLPFWQVIVALKMLFLSILSRFQPIQQLSQ